MRYRITHITNYAYSDAVPVCHNLLHLTPRNSLVQRCFASQVKVLPRPQSVARRTDFFGNIEHYFSLQRPHRQLRVKATSHLEVIPKTVSLEDTPSWTQVRDQICRADRHDCLDALQFCYASPHVPISSKLKEFAEPCFAEDLPIGVAVSRLMARIFQHFRYDKTATNVNSSVEEVLELRRGVCQDFAHLQIGCLRAMGLAARYVSGYLRTIPPPGQKRLVGVDASHAWLSVYTGDSGWVDFDPTNNIVIGDSHITTAWGRDYSDVCPVKGVVTGGGQHTISVSVDVMPEEISARSLHDRVSG